MIILKMGDARRKCGNGWTKMKKNCFFPEIPLFSETDGLYLQRSITFLRQTYQTCILFPCTATSITIMEQLID